MSLRECNCVRRARGGKRVFKDCPPPNKLWVAALAENASGSDLGRRPEAWISWQSGSPEFTLIRRVSQSAALFPPDLFPMPEQQPDSDLFLFSDDTLRRQLQTADEHLGYKILRFYVDERGGIARDITDRTATFYFLPSGGTLRDSDFNLVAYKARFDLYKGMGRA